MNSSKKLAAVVALAISAGLAGTGCMAQGPDADQNTDGQDQAAVPTQQAADANSEKTGTATEKCGLFGAGIPFWGGWGGCGIFGGPFWGGCGGFGLGGFGCGGLGGFGGFGGCW